MAVELDLQGKTAVVTGASSGIGQAIAERFGQAGAFVYLVGRTAPAMEASRERIAEWGGKAEVISLDVRDFDALATVVDRAAEDTGRLDVMVNNAGVGHQGPVLDGELEQWREMFDVNVLALLVGAQAAVRAMRRCGNGGHIVNISSSGALRPDSGVYGSTKYAVNYLTQAIRQELEDDDIRITSVAPGVVATNFARYLDAEVVRGIGALAGMELDVKPGERIPDEALTGAQAALERLIAKPDDIADAVLYIVSLPLRLNIADIVVRPAKQLTLR
jgi:NADP-dependent 3-hydroxy acid dehydrogenase YdfG